jgi:transposase
MEITAEQYERIQDCLPVQRGNVRHQNLVLLNAILYVAEHGCKWRGLPKRYGNWHSIYVRMNRWAKKGVLDQVFAKLQQEQILRIKIEAFSLGLDLGESASRRNWGFKKTDRKPSARWVRLQSHWQRCCLEYQ